MGSENNENKDVDQKETGVKEADRKTFYPIELLKKLYNFINKIVDSIINRLTQSKPKE